MTRMHSRLTFASNSDAKLNEYRLLLQMPNLLREPMPKAETTTQRLDMLVREKCEEASKLIDPPLFVEHTSFEIKALNGLPGVIAEPYFSKTPNTTLLESMEKYKGDDRSAVAKIAVGYLPVRGANIRILEAQTRGHISSQIRGTNGFGWDEIFVPEGEQRTFAEMTQSEKNKISMRANVAASFLTLLHQLENEHTAHPPAEMSSTGEGVPDSFQTALLRQVWSSKPWLRNLVLAVIALGAVAFGVWASFPDTVKERIIQRLTSQPPPP